LQADGSRRWTDAAARERHANRGPRRIVARHDRRSGLRSGGGGAELNRDALLRARGDDERRCRRRRKSGIAAGDAGDVDTSFNAPLCLTNTRMMAGRPAINGASCS
jgi:hypothetical protein